LASDGRGEAVSHTLDDELMALITNYATLQSAVADYLNRQDLTSQIQTFIQFVEADLSTRLRCREMIVEDTLTSTLSDIPVPADWLEAINLKIDGGKSPLRYITLDDADIVTTEMFYTQPNFYTIVDGNIRLVPAPGQNQDIDLIYYAKIPSLSDAVTTNWLLTKAPDVYLYGALVHAAPFLVDDQRIGVFGQFYSQRVEALTQDSQRALHSGSPLVARTRRPYYG
jgi:hypothetical protein